MRRTFPGSILFALFLLLAASPATTAGTPFFPFPDADDSVRIARLVERYLELPAKDTLDSIAITKYAVDEFATWFENRNGLPLHIPDSTPYRIRSIRAIHPDGSLAIATVAAGIGTVPLFGPMSLDWVFFVRSTEEGWRISSLRRQSSVDVVINSLRALDSSRQYPPSLKPIIAHEVSSGLLSNDQLREHFATHHDSFNMLAEKFNRSDSLFMLARTDRLVSQLNGVVLEWGIAAQDVPREAMDEFMATATPAQQQYMREQMQTAAKMRAFGMDTLARVAKRFGLDMARLDSSINLMRDLRVVFVNTRLPWENAVQLTLGGMLDDAVGYIYAPKDVPYISDKEYFYLEDLGDGWWIFRST